MKHCEECELPYGWVRFIKGRLKGQIGLYDDDEGPKAIVYPTSTPGHYILTSIGNIEALSKKEAKTVPYDPLDVMLGPKIMKKARQNAAKRGLRP